MRLYVPATLDLLAQWQAAGQVPPGEPGAASAFEAPDTSEEGEYAALMAAADASTALLSAGGAASGRRVVLVAETTAGDGPVPAAEWVALHADVGDRPVGADPDEDLGWFATQEIPDLLS